MSLRGYELRDRMGEGAFGTVYRAFQPSVQRDVAIKVIKPELANHPEFIRRFEAEAQLVARLEHLHIVPLHDYWRDPSGAYLVMRLLEGGSLKERLAEEALSYGQTVLLVDQVGSALAAAHSSGVVHRDVKPANILFDRDGNAYLSDFGIAKDLGSTAEITGSGRAPGSPAFMAPEQLQTGDVSAQTDIYALGLVIYACLAGHHPFDTDSLISLVEQQLEAPLPALESEVAGLPEGVDVVLATATAKNPAERFADVGALVAAIRGVDTTGTPLAPLGPLGVVTNPYKGLAAFQEADAADFFGRSALTTRLVERVRDNRLVAVVGPSGSGKSSVVRAGLIPSLRRGSIGGSQRWFVAQMIPGSRPFEELEAALLRIAVNPPATLLEQLQRDDGGLRAALKRILPSDGSQLVLVIDQFEEIFTLSDDRTTGAFVDAVLSAVTDSDSRLRVVVTLRADFYDRPLRYEELGTLMRTATETVLPLARSELEQAITAPAERVGVPVEPGLVARIISDVSEEPGALPLMQYALTELFDSRRGSTLTSDVYDDIGGVGGALANRAEHTFSQIPEHHADLTRQIFLRMLTLGEGQGDTRRRVARSELEAIGNIDDIASIVNTFGDARLVSFDRDPTTWEPTVEVAHEALLTQWERLSGWISSSRDDLRTYGRLTTAVDEWSRSGRDPGFLLGGTRLRLFETWAAASTLTLTANDRAFLDRSIERRDEELAAERARQKQQDALEARSRLRLRASVAILAVAAIAAAALTVFALIQADEARQQTEQAQESETNALDAQTQAQQQADRAQQAEQDALDAQTQAQQDAATASSRALIARANEALEADPNLAIHLALEAIATTESAGLPVLPDAQRTLLAVSNAAPRSTPIATFESELTPQLSTDGRSLATYLGGIITVWDTSTGHPRFEIVTDGSIALMAIDHDGTTIATSDGTRIAYRDTRTGSSQQTDPGAGGYQFLEFAANEDRLLATTEEGADIFDDTGRLASQICCTVVHMSWITPDGDAVVLGENLDTTALDMEAFTTWESSTGRLLVAKTLDKTSVGGCIRPDCIDRAACPDCAAQDAFQPTRQGDFAGLGIRPTDIVGDSLLRGAEYVTDTGRISEFPEAWVWIDAISGETVHRSPRAGTRTFAGRPEEFVRGGDFQVVDLIVFDGERESIAATRQAGIDPLYARRTPDGDTMAFVDGLGDVGIFRGETLRPVQTVRQVEETHTPVVLLTPDGTRIVTWVRGEPTGPGAIWELRDPREAVPWSGTSVAGVAFADDENLLMADASGEIYSWDGSSTTLLTRTENGIVAMTAIGDSGLIATLHANGRLASRLSNGELLDEVTMTSCELERCVLLAADSAPTVAVLTGTQALLWTVDDAGAITESNSYRFASRTLSAAALSPQGDRIVAGRGSTADIYDTAVDDGDGLLDTDILGSTPLAFAFHPNGDDLIVGTVPGELIREPIDRFLGEGLEPSDIAFLLRPAELMLFAPDHRTLITTGGPQITAWDAETFDLRVLLFDTSSILAVTISPDSTRLAIGSADGVVRVFTLDLNELISQAQRQLTPLTTEQCDQYPDLSTCG